jgi:hypothetical protein
MPAVADAPDFEQALGDLQDHLPIWWRTGDPTSNFYALLTAIAEQFDDLSALFERPYLDQNLETASAEGLQRNFAFAWGLQNEQLPTVLPQLQAYIQARSEEDGSLQSLIGTLTSLVDTPQNITGGPVLTFPSGGGGLVFPADGSGLTMYEFAPGVAPSAAIGLVFPADGSGLVFPLDPSSLPSDNLIASDGTTPIGAGPGLIFASNEFVQIAPNFATYTLTVQVQNWMSFDRGAFARAVARFQPCDWFPTVIQEVTAYH